MQQKYEDTRGCITLKKNLFLTGLMRIEIKGRIGESI